MRDVKVLSRVFPASLPFPLAGAWSDFVRRVRGGEASKILTMLSSRVKVRIADLHGLSLGFLDFLRN
jgi:hypothetical protein